LDVQNLPEYGARQSEALGCKPEEEFFFKFLWNGKWKRKSVIALAHFGSKPLEIIPRGAASFFFPSQKKRINSSQG
jgi:hypothetical protein